MAAYLFTEAILAGRPIKLFNYGDMKRDFTFIDDIVAGILAALARKPESVDGRPPHRLYNLGNNHPESLLRFVEVLEDSLGRKSQREMLPLQLGDVPETYADIEAAQRDLCFEPSTPIEEGLPRFVGWFRDYHRV
jgi:UDP-glucuronate 4-epimerase